MKIRVGLLGLPNVGKSSLFNAIAQKSLAQAANFPFTTIEPNTAPVAVPDPYLEPLGTFANSKRTVSATIEFRDVAGLVKGASKGEGLGNQFLASLRECDAIVHLVRIFDDKDIVHVDGIVDPVADAEVVNLELLLADLAHVERRLEKTTCTGKERDVLEKAASELQEGRPVRRCHLTKEEQFAIKSMGFLTLKPTLYAFNVDEVDFTLGREEALAELENNVLKSIQYCDPTNDDFALVSAKIEAEISGMSKKEQLEYMISLGIAFENERQLDQILGYNTLPLKIMQLLGLSVCYTGPGVPPERSRTTRAHLFRQHDLTAEGLAGRLHGDIQKGLIRSEVAPAPVLLEHPGYTAAKESGCIRTEGRDYAMKPDDVILFKWK